MQDRWWEREDEEKEGEVVTGFSWTLRPYAEAQTHFSCAAGRDQTRSDAGNGSMGSKGKCGIVAIYVRLVSYLSWLRVVPVWGSRAWWITAPNEMKSLYVSNPLNATFDDILYVHFHISIYQIFNR